MANELIQLTIDGKSISVPKGTTVYKAALQLGIEIPIFCYQDRMPPFGACRVCLVKVENMAKLQASCTLEATDGMVVHTRSDDAIEGRESILEFLLINHPLDCPICDKGGECPLQDHALNFGPGKSRFYEEKRRFAKPYPLGPVLMLDRERCIICARCTRFGDLIAGDHALELIDRGFRSEVGTPDGGPAKSKFIGNTIQICPVGALTSRVYRFRARPWDNLSTPTTCTLCPVGCSMQIDSRDGEVMRTRSKENKEVNDMWLCDKGWFGYEFAYHEDRLNFPFIRVGGVLEKVSWSQALSTIATKIKETKKNGRIAAFGGNTLTTEECYIFQQLIRKGAGINNIDHRIGMNIYTDKEEGISAGMENTIGQCEELTNVFLLGLDLTEQFPVIWLRLKQAINKGAKVTFIGHYLPEITQEISHNVLHAPGEEILNLKKHLSQIENGKKTALFVGPQYLNSFHRLEILSELLSIKQRSPDITLNIMEGTGNSFGARITGMLPTHGLNAIQVLEEAANNGWDILYVAGANPAAKFPEKLWKKAREKIKLLIVQDLFMTETAEDADIILPTLSFLEKEGTFINIEGRAQQINPGKELPEDIFSDGEIFSMIAEALECELDLGFCYDKETTRIGLKIPEHIETKKIDFSFKEDALSATFSGALFDEGERMIHNPHLKQLIEEPRVRIHPNEGIKRGIENGNIVSLSSENATIQAKVKLDSTVAERTIVIPTGFKEIRAQEFGPNLINGTQIWCKRK